MFVDAHCHLEKTTYRAELDAVVQRAIDIGIVRFVAVGSSRVSRGADEAVELAERLDAVFATAGIHPHEAAKAEDADFERIEGHLAHPKVVSLGEIGLDYHYDKSPRDVQRAVFHQQLQMGRRHERPVMLHVREAHEDCLRLLDEVGLPNRGGVVHCFSGGPDEARDYLDRGMMLSIPGIVTFDNAHALRDAVAMTPIERLLTETDCPYLAPVPYRRTRNEPAFIVETVRCVAKIKGISVEQTGRITAQNAITLFGM